VVLLRPAPRERGSATDKKRGPICTVLSATTLRSRSSTDSAMLPSGVDRIFDLRLWPMCNALVSEDPLIGPDNRDHRDQGRTRGP